MQLVTPNNDLSVIEKKRSSWALMGEKIYKQELELQVRAQDALTKIAELPTTIEDIPAAEAALKEVKNLQAQIMADRKAITSKFDPVFERLMAPEKSFTIPMTAYVAAIISVKKEQERKEQEKRSKADEISRIRQAIITAVARYDAEFKTLITEKVNQAFTWALEKGVKPEEIEDYRDRVSFRIKESLFEAHAPEFNPQYATSEDIGPLVQELWKINPADYIAMFILELERKFAAYHIAFLNKQEALKQAKEEQQRRLAEIEAQKQHQEAAAELDAVSTDITISEPGIKALKKAYEVDMPETFENAMKILSAFMGNKQKCLEKVNIKKWFSFDASSAAKALAKVKSDDNQFAPLGITWKEVDKL